jgi:oligosaccharide repeat unit polymerase
VIAIRGRTFKPVMKKSIPATSVLSQAIVISAVTIVCLSWEVVHPSPATLLLLGFAVMSYINYLIGGRDVLYPAFMFTSIWALVAAAYAFCPIEIDSIGWKTVAIFLGGGASFSVGSLLGNRSFTRTKPADRSNLDAVKVRDNPQARNILIGCAVLVTLSYLIIIIRSAKGIFFLNPLFLLMLNSGNSPLNLDDSFSFTKLIVQSSGLIPVLVLWVLLVEDKRKWAIALCAGCVALFPLFVTERGLVMAAFCGSTCLFLLRSRDRSLRNMAVPLSIAALGIVVVMALLSLTKSWHQGPGGYSIADGAWMYMVGPLATFNYAVYHPQAYADQPAAVFAQILTPLSHTGLIHYRTWMDVEGSSLDRFVYVPFPGNVYTAYKPYYEDFGAMGCFAAFALFGAIGGYLFHKAVRGNHLSMFFLAYLTGPLMFSTFDDLYHGFSRHLNIVIFAAIYFGVMKRLKFHL